MKLKLFIFVILILISAVAYKTYADYSALKSIDSYDSCVTAKGSVIQESYPPTCVTRLGNRFSQWTKYENYIGKYTFYYPSSWKYVPDKREVWDGIIIGDGDSKATLLSSVQVSIVNSLNFYVPWSGKKDIFLTEKNLGQYVLLGDTPANTAINQKPAVIKQSINDNNATTNIAVLDNDRIILITIFTPKELSDLHNQILSIFQFLDWSLRSLGEGRQIYQLISRWPHESISLLVKRGKLYPLPDIYGT